MSDDHKYDDPTNRVVCTFDGHDTARDAKAALIEFGFEKQQVHVLQGEEDAEEVDTSAKWFADTDKEIKQFKRELHRGHTVLSVPVKDCDCREEVHQILKKFGATHVTHFGDWITEVMR